ncbi:VOC family protein [Rhizobium hainanense]|uniref:Uncharacterized conserved protein PhnB, glyoxalase superfamily n=1 Tax=Rhizobium hainanense TaxID=52131 RepID=A0A1C3W7Z3_9HYPH|nr:glyoxalase/bleomycin resistance/extradiol dioxygenase family protein [Rhizobium hainanense]SCB35938.1 Uncharacterized conserved protein PhnB, glyoxalase superfamily [Rhizobium hainanense]
MTDATDQTQSQQPRVPVRGGVVAYLTVDGAVKAAEFYSRAFGAEQVFMYPVDEKGRTMHVHLYINGSSVMLGDAFPEYGHALEKPQSFTMQLVVDDLDFWWKRAVDAGAEVVVEPQVMFWGDRWGQLRDPFGVAWAMNAPVNG